MDRTSSAQSISITQGSVHRSMLLFAKVHSFLSCSCTPRAKNANGCTNAPHSTWSCQRWATPGQGDTRPALLRRKAATAGGRQKRWFGQPAGARRQSPEALGQKAAEAAVSRDLLERCWGRHEAGALEPHGWLDPTPTRVRRGSPRHRPSRLASRRRAQPPRRSPQARLRRCSDVRRRGRVGLDWGAAAAACFMLVRTGLQLLPTSGPGKRPPRSAGTRQEEHPPR
jgi:hypothetical protein